ncbi:prenyltransferase [Fusarium albosuccineum]|uniref:Prenyltransferase n=1 Tax=Fusarium albosuccineum TaxID=1237068 RepID=A0A8H4LB91_9HYPO|nr:prenyltransferase [Fusarium albosuccineum]
MSRALDEGLKESLKHGDHRPVFGEISTVLTESSGELLEIELLGKRHVLDPSSSLLRDGNAIAIPKIRLVQAFLVARKLFLGYLEDNNAVSADQILRSTAVMLLMDPEYLTVANTRKRLIKAQLLNGFEAKDVFEKEQYFVDSLLTSRLHRHTKSPTLWNHRRWLMDQFRLHSLDALVEDDLTSIIMISGERHPRNYYAWCHARYLVNTFITPSPSPEEALSRMTTATQKWCFAHHDDISGWQFLTFLLDKRPTEMPSAFRETLKLTGSFKWTNESVWYFLRHIAAWGAANNDLEEFELVRKTLWESASTDSSEKQTLERAEQWLLVAQGLSTGFETELL